MNPFREKVEGCTEDYYNCYVNRAATWSGAINEIITKAVRWKKNKDDRAFIIIIMKGHGSSRNLSIDSVEPTVDRFAIELPWQRSSVSFIERATKTILDTLNDDYEFFSSKR